QRSIRLMTLGEVRSVRERAFVKPVDEKIFPARVYAAGETIDPTRDFADDAPVLASEPVVFGLEVRAFVCERRVGTLSAYVRDGDIARASNGEWCISSDE